MSTSPGPHPIKQKRKNTLRIFYLFVGPCNRIFRPGSRAESGCTSCAVCHRQRDGWRRNLEFPSLPEGRGHTSETDQPRSDELCFCWFLAPHARSRHPATIRLPFPSHAPGSGVDDRLVEHRPNSLFLAVSRMKTRLRVLRAEKEWSQADLADAVGVTRQCINAVETGKYEPGLDLAFKIARIFGKNVEEVFLYEENETSTGQQ